jgi:ABC-type nitrate/sulfonate/bicarbonate transport system permease component
MSALGEAAVDRIWSRRQATDPWAWAAISLASLVSIWWVFSLVVGNPVKLPTPPAVAQEIASLAQNGELGGDIATSLGHLLAGYLIGGALGIGVGFLMGVASEPREVFRVVLEILRPIPPLAWIPAGLLVFGISPQLPIGLIAYSTFFPVWINTMAGVRQLPAPLGEASRALGASRAMLWREVVFPAALPSILVGARVGLGLAWMTIVAAELVGGTSGLGYLIMKSANYLDSAGIIAGMLVIAALSFGMDRCLRWLNRTLCPWMPGPPR